MAKKITKEFTVLDFKDMKRGRVSVSKDGSGKLRAAAVHDVEGSGDQDTTMHTDLDVLLGKDAATFERCVAKIYDAN
jgi:hypothetical protein